MGLLIPTTYLKWREPKAYRKARQACWKRRPLRRRILARAAGIGSLTVLFMLVWLVHRLSPRPGQDPATFEVALLVALAGAGFLCLVLPRLIDLLPNDIRLNEKGIFSSHACSSNVAGKLAAYEEIVSAALVTRSEGGERVSALALTMKRGEPRVIGIGPGVDPAAVARVLEEKGVPVDRREEPSPDMPRETIAGA